MSDRHIFNDHTTLVARSLRGLVAHNPRLNLIPALKTVYRADADRKKVTTICGGGSGHEPGTVGFVGEGFLTAAVAGDVFASPSARQVLNAIKAVPSDKGTILIITNCESPRGAMRRTPLEGHGERAISLDRVRPAGCTIDRRWAVLAPREDGGCLTVDGLMVANRGSH